MGILLRVSSIFVAAGGKSGSVAAKALPRQAASDGREPERIPARLWGYLRITGGVLCNS